MKSNYKRLGDYIKPVREKNTDLKASKLLGINIDKFFMPSVANVVGTDMSNYKIVKKGQFACNRMHVGRDYRIPIALSKEENPFMVSPAYDVFEINNTKVLLPEYLMMWFTRKEFDRNCWFHTDADVRGGLPWNAFCDLELPIPSPEKQQEIVREYNTIHNRITLNNQLISKLEETAQAIYKQWFVEFEFPFVTSSGVEMPYKSNGGKMVWCEELEKEIPEGCRFTNLLEYSELSQGIQVEVADQFFERKEGMNRFLRIIDYTPNTNEPPRYVKINDLRYYCSNDEIAMIRYGDAGTVCRRFNGIIANNLFKITPKSPITNNFLFYYLKEENIQRLIRTSAASSTMPAITHSAIKELPIALPQKEQINFFDKIIQKIENEIIMKSSENQKLEELKDLLLAKLTRVESGIETVV